MRNAVMIPIELQDKAMYNSSIDENAESEIKTTNIFLNPNIHMYIFEVPLNYEMKIDLRFLESKVISAMYPEEFQALLRFQNQTGGAISSFFDSKYHYDCSNLYVSQISLYIIAECYVFGFYLALRMICCENRFKSKLIS